MAKPGSQKWLVVVVLVLAALLVGVLLLDTTPPTQPPKGPVGGDFTLESDKGQVSLSQFKGQYVTLYFGYTSCPDICPTSLGALSQAFSALSADEMAQIQPIFISVDPERDTPSKLADYAAYFHPRMLGVSGSPEQIQELAGRYGVYYHKVALDGSAMSYSVDHSSSIYLIDKQGKLAGIVQHSDTPQAILDEIKKLLAR